MQYLDWNREEVEGLLANARKEIEDPSNHIYTNLYVVYGQRPEEQIERL